MKAANLAGAVLGAILKVAFAVIVVYLVYMLRLWLSYFYGACDLQRRRPQDHRDPDFRHVCDRDW